MLRDSKNIFSNLFFKGYPLIYMVKLDFKFEFLIYIILKWVQRIFRQYCKNSLTGKATAFTLERYIYLKSTPLELSNSVSHNSHTEFMSEVILMTSFSKNTSWTNIFKCKNARKLEKSYFLSTYNGLLTDTHC